MLLSHSATLYSTKDEEKYLLNILVLVVPGKIRNIDIFLSYLFICLKYVFDHEEVSLKTVNEVIITVFSLVKKKNERQINILQ